MSRLSLKKMRILQSCPTLGTSGVAALEFALVAPIFIFLFIGIVEMGAVMFIQNNMVNVTRDASRRTATGEFTTAQAEIFAADTLVDWGISYEIEVTVPDIGDPTDLSVVASITAPMNEAAIIDFLGLLEGRTLFARAVMRRE